MKEEIKMDLETFAYQAMLLREKLVIDGLDRMEKLYKKSGVELAEVIDINAYRNQRENVGSKKPK